MSVDYDRDADAIYIRLRDFPYAYGEDLDHGRRVDYAASGQPIGIELLNVSRGVNLENLPDRAMVEKALESYDIPLFA